MSIIQISRIQVRRGLQENLPQLASAEFGWANDTRKLYIGNGTSEEGAPLLGNTEILTQFSDIFSLSGVYTYHRAGSSQKRGRVSRRTNAPSLHRPTLPRPASRIHPRARLRALARRHQRLLQAPQRIARVADLVGQGPVVSVELAQALVQRQRLRVAPLLHPEVRQTTQRPAQR